MKKTMCVLVVLVIGASALAEKTKPNVELVKGENKIDVMIGGKLFTSYQWGDDWTKPYLAPITTPSGIRVSRRLPLTELKGGTDDHLHHTGVFFAVDGVNGTKFWNNKRKNPPPQIKHTAIKKIADGTLVTTSQWIDKKGTVLLEDERTMKFIAGEGESGYAIDFSLDMTAKADKVVFDDTEEGVFAIRVADCLREEGPKKFLKPGDPAPKESIEGTGVYMSSNGDITAKKAWGKRARWMAMQGVKDGKVVGVAIINHPESINYPCYWHVRDYGLFSANPLGQGDFQRQWEEEYGYNKNRPIPLKLTLKKGEKVHFRFLLVAYEGAKTAQDFEKQFRQFEK
ncbi:MAG: DUF6807 domain-containing protein [Planctomycetota bacterium]|jgi:hypothetical protein